MNYATKVTDFVSLFSDTKIISNKKCIYRASYYLGLEKDNKRKKVLKIVSYLIE